VVVTDSDRATVSHTYSLAVDSAPQPVETTLPIATVGDAYGFVFKASGGSGSGYSFTAAGLPSWLTLTGNGVLQGTPTSAIGSPLSFTVSVTDSNNATGSRLYFLGVDPPLSVGPGTLGTATVGNQFSAQLTATGGSGTGYSFAGVGLPGWLSLSRSGMLTGTPPASVSAIVNFSVEVTDSEDGTVTTSYSLHVDPALSIAYTLPAAVVGANFETQMKPSGGSGSGYTFTASNLPSWLTLSSSGLLEGTPTSTQGSPFTFSITVTDGDGATDTVTIKLTVQKPSVG
jgi:hypothetical protein